MELLERDELLTDLAGLSSAAVRGAGGFCFVAGEAGIGKTVLVQQFCARLLATTAIYRGCCDALGTPRALGPLHDFARAGLPELRPLLVANQDRHGLFTAFLDLLAAKPFVAVVEDAHWADEATLDLLLFVARRVADLPGLVIVTYRTDDVDRAHPLRRLLGDLASVGEVRRLGVPPLSAAAVTELAASTGRDAGQLYAVTGGNPFFVTEALSSPSLDVPGTVRDAVLARVSRLGVDARNLLDLASLVAEPASTSLLEAVVGQHDSTSEIVGLADAVRSGMLVLDGPTVSFRHELARQAVAAEVPPTRAATLHGHILRVLAATSNADPAQLSFHAASAGDADAVLRYAPVAGALAARLGAHREAAEHYARALDYAVGVSPEEAAELWEGRCDGCERTHWASTPQSGDDQLAAAIRASTQVVEIWRTVGDVDREVAAMARRSHLLWNAGRRDEAMETARGTEARLELLAAGRYTARAYSALARLKMITHDDANALSMGLIAIDHARRFGDGTALAHALGVVGALSWVSDPERALAMSTAGFTAARDAGDDLTAGAMLCSIGAGFAEIRRYRSAEHWLAEAVTWCAERDLDHFRDLAIAWQARCDLEQGRWDDATAASNDVLGTARGMGRAVALTVVGQLRSRRGDPGARAALDEAWSLVAGSGDVRRLWPVAAARAECAWFDGIGASVVVEILDVTYRFAVEAEHPWAIGELGCRLAAVGAAVEVAAPMAPPFASQFAGDWAGAAQLWADLGCPYDAILARAECDDVDMKLAALADLQSMGAWPAAQLLARQLRERGVRTLPRRPQRATRANPAGLTDRQVDVLALITEGLRNADIAARLHISPKTVDHHVSAILAKLGVESRQDAARWAREFLPKDDVPPRKI